jgi:RNA polymerase primary sigma factor
MDRTVAKAKTTRRRPAASGARRDKPARRSARGGELGKGVDRAMPRPANDQGVGGRARRAALDLTPPEPGMPIKDEGVEFPENLDVVAEEPNAALEDELELSAAATVPAEDLAETAPEAEDEEEAEVLETREFVAPDNDHEEEEERASEKREEEPQSFLAMYFRDMAELEVLRPEQEFETARKIEELELDLWRTLLGFAPGAVWMTEAVERAIERPLPDFKPYRALAERARKRASGPTRTRLEKLVAQIATKLKEMDIDRIFVDAAVTEVRRVNRAVRNGMPLEAALGFATTKAFKEFVHAVLQRSVRVKQAKNEFVKANLRLVVSIARRFNHGRLPLPDLIQEGNIGLMKAVERYDYRRGFRFSTYASWWIRHAISRALADKGRAVRLPVHMIDAYHRIAKSERELQSKLERPATTEEIASATGIEADKLEKMKTFLSETPVSLDRPISDEDGRRLIDVLVDPNESPSPPDQMMTSETQREMLHLLGGLKPIEADILRKRFGLVNDRERTLKEIGDEYHLSRERVRQLQEQALGKMRKAMAKREIL